MRKTFFIFVITIFIIYPLKLGAVTAGDLGILPAHPDPNVKYSDSRFIFNLGPTETKEDSFFLINNSSETVPVKIYPVDAATTSDGVLAPEEEYEPRQEIGDWITLSQDIVDLPPRSKTEIPFTITIPKDAEVGDHIGAIIMEKVKRGKAEVGASGVEIISRVGVGVIETVPGEIVRSLKLAGFDWMIVEEQPPVNKEFKDNLWYYLRRNIGLGRKIHFLVSMDNEGNTKLEPKGEIEIKNVFGKTIGVFGAEKETKYLVQNSLGLLLPKKSTRVPIIWQKNAPIFDRLSVNLKVFYDESKQPEQASLTIWIIPYTLLAILGVLVFLIVLLYYLWKLIIYKQKAKMWHYEVRQGDNIHSIATLFDKDWKLIAKINKIKPPYLLAPGKSLVIPTKRLFRYFIGSLFGSVAFWLIILLIFILAFGAELYFIKKDKDKREQVSQLVGETIKFSVPTEKALEEAIKRDDQRKIDLAVIQNALDKYYKDWQKSPLSPEMMRTYEKDNILEKELVKNGYLESLAKDPIHPTYFYGYKTDSEGKSYQLTCVLENPNDSQGEKIGKYLIYRVESKP